MNQMMAICASLFIIGTLMQAVVTWKYPSLNRIATLVAFSLIAAGAAVTAIGRADELGNALYFAGAISLWLGIYLDFRERQRARKKFIQIDAIQERKHST